MPSPYRIDTSTIKTPTWTREELDKLVEELLDPRKVLLVCEKHLYVAGHMPPPPNNCPNCWRAHFIHSYAMTPPHRRDHFLGILTQAIVGACRLEDQGKLDINVWQHPHLHIDKGA